MPTHTPVSPARHPGAELDAATVHRIVPPYTRIEPVGLAACDASPDGTLLALRVDAAPSPAGWAGRISALQRAFPRYPIVAVVPSGAPPGIARVVCEFGKLGVHTVLGEGEPIYATLRPLLTNPPSLAHDVLHWLRLRRIPLNPELEFIARGIFEHAAHAREVSETCRRIGEPESGARARFRKKGLPPPSAWHQVARALCAALRIQADSATSLMTIAWDLGYASHASLSRQFFHVFGLRPSQLRDTLGWEWLLARWCRRTGMAAVSVATEPAGFGYNVLR